MLYNIVLSIGLPPSQMLFVTVVVTMAGALAQTVLAKKTQFIGRRDQGAARRTRMGRRPRLG